MTIPNENVGFTSTLTDLPGCNPLWVGTGPKPTCDPNPPTPNFVSVKSPLPSGWTELGCIAEGTTGRAFTSASTTDPAMTKTFCANYCGNLGYPFAGVEYGDECYCGSEFSNGAVNQTVIWSECSVTCAGNRKCFCLAVREPSNNPLLFYSERELWGSEQVVLPLQPIQSLRPLLVATPLPKFIVL